MITLPSTLITNPSAMDHFSAFLRTGQGGLHFYFNLVKVGSDEHYHVSVMDRTNKLQVFHMKQESGRWQIVKTENIEGWIVSMESTFEGVILEQLKGEF